jgi:predicted transposase/invertase (TIGR01784 family)
MSIKLDFRNQKYMIERSLYYSTYAIRGQSQKGNWQFKFNRVYVISILDFNLRSALNSIGEIITWVGLCDIRSGAQISDRLSLIFLEMRNFTKSLDECETHFDKWLYLIRHLSTLKTVPAALQHRIFKRIFDMAKIGEMTRDEYLESKSE